MTFQVTSLLIFFGVSILATSAQMPIRPNYPPIGQFVVPVDQVEAFAISYEPLKGDPTRFLVSFLPVDPQLRTYVNGMKQSLEEIQRLDNGRYSYPAFLLGFRSVNGGVIYPMNLHYSPPGHNSQYHFNPNLPILTPTTSSTAKTVTDKIKDHVTTKAPNQSAEQAKKEQEKVENIRQKRSELAGEEETTTVFERQSRNLAEKTTTDCESERKRLEKKDFPTPLPGREPRQVGDSEEETTQEVLREKRETEEWTTPISEEFRQARELVEESTTPADIEVQKREVEDETTPLPNRLQRELEASPEESLGQSIEVLEKTVDDAKNALRVIVQQLLEPEIRQKRTVLDFGSQDWLIKQPIGILARLMNRGYMPIVTEKPDLNDPCRRAGEIIYDRR